MQVYTKFITFVFLKSFFKIFIVMLSIVLILNLLSELDFFRDIKVDITFPLFLSLLNSFSLIFEMFPFIFLLATQIFFINFFKNNELDIFKYSGLKNLNIIKILSLISFIMGMLIIVVFYNISSNFKNFYLELKSKYTSDDKYLAVITNNGLWIKDKVNDKILIINSSKIEPGFLINSILSEFDKNFQIIRTIQSDRIDIADNEWIIYDANVFINNNITKNDRLIINSNFNYERIQSLFSNLSSLSFLELFELKNNYKLLGYSTIELDVHIQKLISYPFYLFLMTILSAIIMFNSKKLKNTSIKISIGLFSSVIIYYINNFFNVLGNTEKISFLFSVWAPLLILGLISGLMLRKINEK